MTTGQSNSYHTICETSSYDGVDTLNNNCYSCQGSCSKCDWTAGSSNYLCLEECTAGTSAIQPFKTLNGAISGLCVNSCEVGFFIKTVTQSITGTDLPYPTSVRVCHPCSQEYTNCLTCSPTQCLSCLLDYFLNPTTTPPSCALDCPAGYYADR